MGATPLFVVNLFAVAAIVGGGAFTYLLAHSITGRALPSLLAGMVYGFFTNRMDHLGQFTYQMAAFSPLILWTLHRVLRDARWRDLAVLGGALWAQTLSGLYQAFGLVFALGGFAAAYLLLRPSALTRRLVFRGVLILALLAIALAPFLWPYVAHRQELGLRRDVSESEWYGMDLLSLFDPGIFNTLYGKRLLSLDRSEGGLFPGFVALGLAAVALGTLAAASPTGSPRWIRRTQCILTATAALCLIVVAVAATGALDFRAGILRRGRQRRAISVAFLHAGDLRPALRAARHVTTAPRRIRRWAARAARGASRARTPSASPRHSPRAPDGIDPAPVLCGGKLPPGLRRRAIQLPYATHGAPPPAGRHPRPVHGATRDVPRARPTPIRPLMAPPLPS